MNECMYVCMHVCMHACMYVCMYVWNYVCALLYIFTCDALSLCTQVRLEDVVLVNADGPENLTTCPRLVAEIEDVIVSADIGDKKPLSSICHILPPCYNPCSATGALLGATGTSASILCGFMYSCSSGEHIW